MKTQINVQLSGWVAHGEAFPAGLQEIEVSEDLAPALAHAVELGVVELVDPSEELLSALDGHVQSQQDGEQALAEAMGDWVPPKRRADGTTEPGYWAGPWYDGHISAQELVEASKNALGAILITVDLEPETVEISSADVGSLGEVL